MNSTTRAFSEALSMLVACGLLGLACAPAAPARPAAPAKPTEAAKPAAPASPAAPSPAASPSPVASPAAKPAAFDERAVADFYRGKTLRLVVGTGVGGLYDVTTRLVARYIGKYVPGSPTVIVENRTGAGGLIAYNAIYNTEPKDGTAILSAPPLILLAVMGADGVAFDPAKMVWLGSADKSFSACIVRSDLGIKTIEDLTSGKQIVLGTLGPGNSTHDIPNTLNATIGTNFKLVSGYETLSKVRLLIQSGEVDGYCPVFVAAASLDRNILEGESPFARIVVHTSNKPEDHPFLKGVPFAEGAAKTEEGKVVIRAVDAQQKMNLPYSVAPAVPPERVAALQKALADTLADPQLRADAEQANLSINPNTGDEVKQIVDQLTGLSPEVVAKLKAILQ